MQSEDASSLQPTPLPASSGERSDLRTVIAVAMVAYAASSVVHELVEHGSACLLTGVKPVLVTSILLQSAGGNRIVDVGGPVANILFGAGAYYWFQRQAKFTAFSYSLWLFAALNLLVAAGYLFYSGVSNWGDWASAIRELHPQYAWRAAISLAGMLLYILVVRLLCRSLTKLVREGGIGRSDVRRLIYPAYFTCGLLAVTAAAFNPASPRLIWVSGFSGSFLAFLGLLRIPGVVDEYTTEAHAGKAIPFNPTWTAFAAIVAIVFIFVLGPGIRL